MTADTDAPTAFILAPGRTAGWKFTVNADIQLTALGVYDKDANGLQISYPVGIWDEQGAMMASLVVPSGSAAPLSGGFRYMPFTGLVFLSPGQTYTIGYFAASIASNDQMIHQNGFNTLNPLINQVGAAFVTSTPSAGLMMPDSPFNGFDQWIGPGFQFVAIPAPSALCCLAAGFMFVKRRRQR
jgi:hypothetical protein